jgi:hypothetical protein
MRTRILRFLPANERKIGLLQNICAKDTAGRGITSLANKVHGSLFRVAQSIAGHATPRVAILTGFYIAKGFTSGSDTDGPLGTAHLAVNFASLNIPVSIVTDQPNAPAVAAALNEAARGSLAKNISLRVIPLGRAGKMGRTIGEVLMDWRRKENPVTHAISIERVGPSYDGVPRNMLGNDISAHTAPLHRLFAGGKWFKIGIGDGGNEIGMGIFSDKVLARNIRYGKLIGSSVPANETIVCGVSNWGGYALSLALGILRPEWMKIITRNLTPQRDLRILKAMVQKGNAVDGITGEQKLSVDGLPWSQHREVLLSLLKTAHERVN